MLTKRKKEKKMITDNTKAYVYKITVNSTNKKYIGFHKLSRR